MIKVKRINRNERVCSCDNCNTDLELFVMKYEFYDGNKTKPWNEFCLCEDCSTVLARLHYMSMEDGKNFIYNQDGFTEWK